MSSVLPGSSTSFRNLENESVFAVWRGRRVALLKSTCAYYYDWRSSRLFDCYLEYQKLFINVV